MVQFNQFGIELMQDAHPLSDVHAIEMASTILEQLQISEHVALQINSLGDESSRLTYRNVLEEYLKKHRSSLSRLSQTRLERGSVLRVLDSKEQEDIAIVQDAPSLESHLSKESSERFKWVMQGLDALGITYTVNPRLVRGLDYYNDTCFEFVATGGNASLGQAVIAGGRYDRLAETMGGKPMPGIGWAAGVERLASLVPDSLVPSLPPPIAIIPVSEATHVDDIWAFAMRLTHSLRAAGIPAHLSSETSAGKHTKKAAKLGSKYCIYVGSEELGRNTVLVRDMDARTQFECPVDDLKTLFPMYSPDIS